MKCEMKLESILSYFGFPLRLKAASMSFAFQLSLIFITSVAIIAQRDKETGIGSSAVDCPANDGTIGNCLTVIQCRRKMSQLKNFQTPNTCFVQQGVRYLCCPVTGIKRSNTKPLDGPRPENPKPKPDIKHTPSTTHRPPSDSSHGFNLPDCGRSAITTPDTGTIVGGRQAKKHAWPWMAAIRSKTNEKNTQFICGGSLITKRHVLTAAHCFGPDGSYRASIGYKVVLGGHYRDSGTPTFPEEEEGVIVATPKDVRIHENYNKEEGQDNDIAVIVLDRDISFNDYVKPICLPTVANYQVEEGLLTVIGWGHTSFNGSSSSTLQEVNIEAVKTRRCRYLYRRVQLPKGITDNMLCAGNVKGERDSCQLDSGGPLMVLNTAKYTWTQVGIVSFGLECGVLNKPGVYVKVSNYLAWIQQIIRHT